MPRQFVGCEVWVFYQSKCTPFLNLNGTRNGLRSFADLRTYKSIGPKQKLTFATRAQLGSIIGPSLQNAPTDFLLYSSGGGTVRSHEYQSLSVDLGGGRIVGGRSFAAFSGEVRGQIRDNLSLVGFYDVCYVGSEEFPDGESGDWHSGIGVSVGVRYDTGIVPYVLMSVCQLPDRAHNPVSRYILGLDKRFETVFKSHDHYILFFSAAVLALSAVEDDKDFLTRLLQDSLGGEGRSVLVTGFCGVLSSSASVEEITITDDLGVWLTLSDLNFKWNRTALLRGQIDINQLVAKTITLDRYPNAPDTSIPSLEAREFKLPEFPVAINIADLRAERITLNPVILGEAVSFRLQTALRLANGEGRIDALASRTDGARGEFKMIAEYVENTNSLTLDIALIEAADGITGRLLKLPGRPSVDLSIKGDGPLDEFEADFQIGTNNKKRLSGEIAICTRNVSQSALIT